MYLVKKLRVLCGKIKEMNTIIENIALWTTAQTPKTSGRGNRADNQQLLGIQKLRELILELAVRGKLTQAFRERHPELVSGSNSASVLLKKIEAEKKRLIKEGKIKKQEVFPEVRDNEKHFETPRNWEWTRLGNICEIIRGITFSASEKSSIPEEGRVACLRTSNVQDKIEWEDLLFIREVFVKRKDQFIQENDIVMSMANSRELVGKVAIVDKMPSFQTTFGGFLGVLRPIIIDPFYLMLLLREPTNRDSLIDSASQTTNIANISLAKLNPLTLAIPPLAEQHRIVAKVDELMALCDQLEQQQTENNQLHQTLVDTLLTNLTQAGPAEQEDAWQRIANHFDTLFTTEYSIDQLKQTILQLAVMGKLVPQDPADQPASELLKKIAKEKARLVKEGKIKKQAPLPEITDDEKPFELPEGWEWVKFEYISENSKNAFKAGPFGSALKKDMYVESGFKIYGQEQVISGDENYGDYYINNTKYNSLESCAVKPGDILISLVGTIGKVLILSKDCKAGIINPRLVKLSLYVDIFRPYIQLMLGSPLIQEELSDKSHGGTMNILNLGLIRNLTIPLPPVNEQHRIVAKVEELFALCDALKERLAQAQTTQNLLAGAVVAQALGFRDLQSQAVKTRLKTASPYAINEQMDVAAEPE